MSNFNPINWLKSIRKTEKIQKKEVQNEIDAPKTNSSYGYYGDDLGQWWPIRSKYYDGEKTVGELGTVLNNIIDHRRIRMRAYDAYLKTDLAKIISNSFFRNVIGTGLKLQAEPHIDFLATQNITVPENFSKIVEDRFHLWANSNLPDYSGMENLHKKAYDCFKSAFIGGDCLVITRFEDRGLTVQLIDGEHIGAPLFATKMMQDIEERGNFIDGGVEYNQRGEHVAFYVTKRKPGKIASETERILARNELGLEVAWMVYGDKFRLDHKRGISRLANQLEKINKIDRYSEAAVGKAEQAANIFMAIEHDVNSTGEDPFQQRIARKLGSDTEKNLDGTTLADDKAREIRETTSNMTVNLPAGAKLNHFSTDIESNYSEFYKTNFDVVASSAELPPEVAIQSFNSNYTASKAALDTWQSIIDFYNNNFGNNFYKKIYSLHLIQQVLSNKISAPGLIEAFNSNDAMITLAYYNCRFIGYRIPHVDPMKEVKAVREMLGGDGTPLMSLEQAAERLNLGDYKDNIQRFKKDKEIAPEPEIPEQRGTGQENNNINKSENE
jgi:capsid protein